VYTYFDNQSSVYGQQRGPIYDKEHCFQLTHARTHAFRQSLAPDEHVPFWIVDPTQLLTHYHRGMGVVSYLLQFPSRWVPTRSVLPVKTTWSGRLRFAM